MNKKPTVNRPVERQMKLFKHFNDFDFTSVGSLRTHYGKAMEELACAFLGIYTIPINGNYDVNFDAFYKDQFYEIKSVQASGKVVIYDWRMEKEKPFGKNLTYVFVVHKVKSAKSNRDLWRQIESKGVSIFNYPASTVHEEALKCPLKVMNPGNKRAGWNRKGYSNGYRNLPLKNLIHPESPRVGQFRNIKIYDFKIPVLSYWK